MGNMLESDPLRAGITKGNGTSGGGGAMEPPGKTGALSTSVAGV